MDVSLPYSRSFLHGRIPEYAVVKNASSTVWPPVSQQDLVEDALKKVESAHMQYASTIEEALTTAKLISGERVLAVPEGPSVILKLPPNLTR